MKKHTAFMPPAVGISSLLVIFAVLCLCVFTLLSMATVQADGRLGDKNQQAVQQYYASDSHAQYILARLRQGQVPEGVSRVGNAYHFTCRQSDNLALQVRVDANTWQVLHYRSVSTLDWQAQEHILVWDGK